MSSFSTLPFLYAADYKKHFYDKGNWTSLYAEFRNKVYILYCNVEIKLLLLS